VQEQYMPNRVPECFGRAAGIAYAGGDALVEFDLYMFVFSEHDEFETAHKGRL
jgi:hypothetical protein